MNWMEQAEKEELGFGAKLKQGDTFLYLEDIKNYEKLDHNFGEGNVTRFKIIFRNEELEDLILPQSVFSVLQESIREHGDNNRVVGIRVTRQGKTKNDTKYTTIIQYKKDIESK